MRVPWTGATALDTPTRSRSRQFGSAVVREMASAESRDSWAAERHGMGREMVNRIAIQAWEAGRCLNTIEYGDYGGTDKGNILNIIESFG